MLAAIALAALALASGGAGTSPVQRTAAVATTEAIDAQFDALVAEAELPLAGVLVFDAQGPIYQRLTPTLTRTQPVPIASASKWVAAALIMTAVDRGELTLDDPVGKWIPEAPPTLRSATLRQLLSHTSGMAAGDLSAMGPVSSLEESVLKLIARPMARSPGAGFAYGGASMQVAGLMLERAAKRPYATLFAERIAGPLGMLTAAVG
jgi:CubicO group peptidase (beta-lactamase class C family)